MLHKTKLRKLPDKTEEKYYVFFFMFQIINELVVFDQGDIEKEFSVFILDDGSPESDESVFLYLTEPTGQLTCRTTQCTSENGAVSYR